ncbi:MAG: hypothetical protein PVH38_12280 [Gammaproteobacteria bacterium]
MRVSSLKSTRPLTGLRLAALAGQGQTGDLAVAGQDIDVSGQEHDPDWRPEINHDGTKVNFTLAGSEYSYRYP